MARFTIHEPKDSKDRVTRLENTRFVRDGWSWQAFLFGPLWLIMKRHWVFGTITLIAQILLIAGIWQLPIPEAARLLVILALAILWGFEGASVRRFDLAQAGFSENGLILGSDEDHLEQRYFAVMAGKASAGPASSTPDEAPRGPWGSPVIGLFPESRKHP
ncbi:MAG: DUF2628 domain-containing protein [Proteobacteria bacterium]|nr:DUF2628 domain-containing protein [Pseudomonadota bacterium]